ncbi:MAG: DinB family protein [Anaerolineae bacterium]|nr:DinB family protein [Anaerolineae bacterium]
MTTPPVTLDAIRTMVIYHYAAYERMWDCIDTLTDEKFVHTVPYSIGSLRNHVIHLASVEQRWLARVTKTALPERLDYDDYVTREAVRTVWDVAAARVRAALDRLTDAAMGRMVTYQVRRIDPVERTFEATTAVWRILLHVINHGTDHRAQILHILHDFGAPTFEQDAIIHWWDQAE